MTLRLAGGRRWRWPAAVLGCLAGEVAVGAVSLWLLRHSLPCVWSGAEALGFDWHPGLVCLRDAGLLGRRTWLVAATLAIVVLAGVAWALASAAWRLWRTRNRVRDLLTSSTTVPAWLRRTADEADIADLELVEVSDLVCFCVGVGGSRVVISTGMVEALPRRQLQAVLAHEAAHLRAGDPTNGLCALVLNRLLFFAPVLAHWVGRVQVLAEWRADSAAEHRVGRGPLTRALHTVLTTPAPEYDPRLATAGIHATDARIDRLASRPPPSWRPSWRQWVISCVAGAALAGLLISAVPPALEAAGRIPNPIPADVVEES